MIEKRFGKDFFSQYGCLTLQACEVSDSNQQSGYSKLTHDDGWTIEGKISEDLYCWVQEFEASHPEYGRVWGDFEQVVYADSEAGFAHFYEHHKPEDWDGTDI